MKRLLLISLTLSFLAGNAFAVLGDIVDSWPLPVMFPRGVAKSNYYTYYIAYQSPNVVVQLNPYGSFVSSWPCPNSSGNRGLAYSWGGYVWIGNYADDNVYCCKSSNGSIYYSWNAGHDPFALAPYCTGDGAAGTSLIISYDTNPNRLYYHFPGNGSLVYSTPLADVYSFDMTYDWRNRLIWKYNSGISHIYGMHYLNGSIVASFVRPYAGTAYCLAYSYNHLYIACSNSWMYKVHCPALGADGTSVSPASMGSIKAMFR
jgi:hypothetical protein